MTPEQIEKWLAELDAASAAKNAPKEITRITPKYRAPLDAATVAKMRHMRREGFTIGDIARAAKCTWRTAWARTKGFSA
jgi:SOS response regulatory protein OraA/RecX